MRLNEMKIKKTNLEIKKKNNSAQPDPNPTNPNPNLTRTRPTRKISVGYRVRYSQPEIVRISELPTRTRPEPDFAHP